MSQNDMTIANSTGANVRADINSALQAIATNNSGSSAPSTTFATQFFADTNAGIMKLRNTSNNGYVNLFTLAGGIDVDAASTFSEDVTFEGASANIIFDKSDNQLEFADNVNASFGNGGDLKLFHNGTNSHIHSATGELDIRTGDFHLRNEANNEDMITATQNGPVELFYDGARVFETDSGSVKIRDNIKANFGTGNDLQIFHDGSDSYISNVGTGELIIQPTSNEIAAVFRTNGSVELFHDNSKKFETTSSGVTIEGSQHRFKGDIRFDNNTNTEKDIFFDESENRLNFFDDVKATFGNSNDLTISHNGTNSIITNNTGVLAIQSGNLQLQDQANSHPFLTGVGDGAVELYFDNSKKCVTDSTGLSITGRIHTQLGTNHNSFNLNSSGKLVSLMTDGTERGNISSNGSTVQFNTSASDRSMKKNFEDWTENTLNLFKNINAQKFNFLDQEDGTDKEKGFIAQDMVASFPEAYQKNDDDKYMFNPSAMVVYLMKAIQELEAKVAVLEAA